MMIVYLISAISLACVAGEFVVIMALLRSARVARAAGASSAEITRHQSEIRNLRTRVEHLTRRLVQEQQTNETLRQQLIRSRNRAAADKRPLRPDGGPFFPVFQAQNKPDFVDTQPVLLEDIR